MKKITDVLMSKQFLIGLGVGIAGVYAYNMYMKKEDTSSAEGGFRMDCPCGTIKCTTSCDECCKNSSSLA
jgi:hypothetical protein